MSPKHKEKDKSPKPWSYLHYILVALVLIGVLSFAISSRVGAAGKAFANSTLHTVTYASHGGRDDRFCRAVESAIREGHDLVILGWGEAWKGLSQKLSAAYEYALSLPPQDMLLFTDAFDVLFQGQSVL